MAEAQDQKEQFYFSMLQSYPQPSDVDQQFCRLPPISSNTLYSDTSCNIVQENQDFSVDNACHYSQDFINWDTRISSTFNEKNNTYYEKSDLVQLSSKDISPGSLCSNIDYLMPDIMVNYKSDLQCLSNITCSQQPTIEMPSCSQVKSNSVWIKNSAPLYSGDCLYNKQGINKTNDSSQDSAFDNYKNCEEQTYKSSSMYSQDQLMDLNKHLFPLEPLINSFEKSEYSNEDSDIIVEESDDDYVTSENNIQWEKNYCSMCNAEYRPTGLQFFYLTHESPLTMSSQIPVLKKIQCLMKTTGLPSKANMHICCQCLGLINTLDNLQHKLRALKKDIISVFKNANICTIAQKNNVKSFPRYKCKKCKMIICVKMYLKKHLAKHTKYRTYLCETCGVKFYSKQKLFIHASIHTKTVQPEKYLKCYNCGRIFKSKSNLKEHKNFCLGILPYKCKNHYCDKSFPTVTKLKNHVKLKHDKKFISICSICNIGFVKASSYKYHMLTHSTEKKFPCSKCDKSYKTLSNLNFHLKSHCDKLPHVCSICSREFMRKEYLEAHINNHKELKKFNCSVCDRKFVSQKYLESHLKYHEGTVKKHTCNICGKTMTKGFEDHLRIHNNLREFECDMCNLKFNTKGTLLKHKKKKHSQNTNITDANKA